MEPYERALDGHDATFVRMTRNARKDPEWRMDGLSVDRLIRIINDLSLQTEKRLYDQHRQICPYADIEESSGSPCMYSGMVYKAVVKETDVRT